MAEHETGPRGGVTTVAPSGWQKTTVYLRKDQIRTLKVTALQRGNTMSAVLRAAIDHYFGLVEEDCRLTEYQRETAEMILREQFGMEDKKVAEFLARFDRICAIEES